MGVRNSAGFAHGPGVLVACTTSSGSTRVDMGAAYDVFRVHNAGTVAAHIAFFPSDSGSAAVPTSTAATNNFTIGAGSTDVFVAGGCRYVAGITGSSTASVFVHSGRGQ